MACKGLRCLARKKTLKILGKMLNCLRFALHGTFQPQNLKQPNLEKKVFSPDVLAR